MYDNLRLSSWHSSHIFKQSCPFRNWPDFVSCVSFCCKVPPSSMPIDVCSLNGKAIYCLSLYIVALCVVARSCVAYLNSSCKYYTCASFPVTCFLISSLRPSLYSYSRKCQIEIPSLPAASNPCWGNIVRVASDARSLLFAFESSMQCFRSHHAAANGQECLKINNICNCSVSSFSGSIDSFSEEMHTYSCVLY